MVRQLDVRHVRHDHDHRDYVHHDVRHAGVWSLMISILYVLCELRTIS